MIFKSQTAYLTLTLSPNPNPNPLTPTLTLTHTNQNFLKSERAQRLVMIATAIVVPVDSSTIQTPSLDHRNELEVHNDVPPDSVLGGTFNLLRFLAILEKMLYAFLR
jgi:hypothetical protein